jgi:hypothetical protein
MKVKRFDNLWLMGLIISGAILGAVYILKFFFPAFVIEVAHIDSIVKIGHFIDEHKWAWYLASFIVSFVIYYFYCCACCKVKKLNGKYIIAIIACILGMFVIKEISDNIYMGVNFISLVALPCIMKGDFKATTISFAVVNIVQPMTLEIRGLALMVTDFNFATALILMIDYYIIEFLLYFYFNYKKEE